MKFKLNTKVLGAEKQEDGTVLIKTESAKGGKEETLDADVVLVAVGRRPYTEGLNLEAIGAEVDNKGRIVVDSQYNTSVPGVKCIGDATFGPMLAHKAEEEGIAVAEYLKTGHGHVNYAAIPAVVYTHPEVAWVGANEQELKANGTQYKVGKFPFIANSRAKTNLDTEGFVKFLVEKDTDRILGCHIIGPNAGEMIASAVLAMEYSASAEDIARTTHAHVSQRNNQLGDIAQPYKFSRHSVKPSRRLRWRHMRSLYTFDLSLFYILSFANNNFSNLPMIAF